MLPLKWKLIIFIIYSTFELETYSFAHSFFEHKKETKCTLALTSHKDCCIVACDWIIEWYTRSCCLTGVIPRIIDIRIFNRESTQCLPKLVRIGSAFIIFHCINGDSWRGYAQFCVVVQPDNGWNRKPRNIAIQCDHTLKVSDILILWTV